MEIDSTTNSDDDMMKVVLTKVTSRNSSSSLISEKAEVMLEWKSFQRRQNCWSSVILSKRLCGSAIDADLVAETKNIKFVHSNHIYFFLSWPKCMKFTSPNRIQSILTGQHNVCGISLCKEDPTEIHHQAPGR